MLSDDSGDRTISDRSCAKPAHTPLRPVSQEKRLIASKEAVSAEEQKEREELFRKLDEARSRNAKKVRIARWRFSCVILTFLAFLVCDCFQRPKEN